MEQVIRDLEGAAAAIEKHGHVKCHLVDPNGGGGFCLVGAINVTVVPELHGMHPSLNSEGRPRVCAAIDAVAAFLGVEDVSSDVRASKAVRWNNDPVRTKAEVVAALRGTAEMVRREQEMIDDRDDLDERVLVDA
jgi:hypothetical protein